MTPRGGARPGAGGPTKPPGEKAQPVTVKLHPKTIARLRSLADERGVSQAQVITLALQAFESGAASGEP